jgi:uncharacterized membrane protein
MTSLAQGNTTVIRSAQLLKLNTRSLNINTSIALKIDSRELITVVQITNQLSLDRVLMKLREVLMRSQRKKINRLVKLSEFLTLLEI